MCGTTNGQRGVRWDRTILGWTWRGWLLTPVLATGLLAFALGTDVLVPSIPVLYRILGWPLLRHLLNVLSFQSYTLFEPEFGVWAILLLLVFDWFRPRRARWWDWGLLIAWAIAAQRIHQEFFETMEIVPGIHVVAGRLTLVGTVIVLMVFWRSWLVVWPVAFLGIASIVVWHGTNIYNISIPWECPKQIDVAVFYAAIVWTSVIACRAERIRMSEQTPDCCGSCGYDLCGLAIGTRLACPECGAIRRDGGNRLS
ncbi:MAG: hypothetical protein J0L78_00370 [Planctomycetes bacterium]|nr:hypothetical protein [Planctomycetota bacterium]